MRLPPGRPTALLLFLKGIILYSVAWALIGSFEKRTVPVDFRARYLPIADNIIQRGDFLLEGRAPSPPMYPLALAGLAKLGALFRISAENAAKTFNVLAMALVAVLFHSLVQRFMDERTALIAALVWVTYPFGIYLTLQPGPEPLYLLFLIMTALAVAAAREGGPLACLAAGAAGSMAMLVKPMALFLPLFLLVFLVVVWTRRRVPLTRFALSCSLFVVGLSAAILPWEAYLWQRTGKFVPVADKAGSSIYDGWTFGLRPGAGGDQARLPEDVVDLMGAVADAGWSSRDGEVLGALRRAAAARPAAFLKLFLIKAGRCWYGTDEMWHEGKILMIQLFYLALSLIGAVIWFRSGKPGGWLLAGLGIILLYHWAAATAALSILRYMVSAGFLMAVMAAFVIAKLSPSTSA